ncbi:SDR family NAD(P)-dependent oxidoreductase [Nostoc sp. C117]|uniref:SDR family NAD(P)-dependent oxidoreductase n=1 Tax=Nostoc sp. C117 TaxID=3349875 RepID=UPI00370D54C7
MNLNLKNKLVLVTGSTAGIGKSVARGFLEEGAEVVINSRSQEQVEVTVNELKPFGKVYGVAADLSNPNATAQLIAQVSQIGHVDILINNVGYFEAKPFEQVTDDEWFYLFNLNVMSGVRLTRVLLPKMLEQNWGRVIFVASETGVKPMPDMIHYSVTKTAIIGLSRALAELTKGTKVTVNSVLPASTWTKGMEIYLNKIAHNTGLEVEELTTAYFSQGDGKNSLLQRFLTPQEVTDVILFLCSVKASAINGVAQRVEGGLLRSIL